MHKVIIGFVAGIATTVAARAYWHQCQGASTRPDVSARTSPRSSRKQNNLEQLKRLFEQREVIRNHDIVAHLSVSPKTARNYCDQLEEQGIITQRGATGRDVYYVLTRA